MPIHLFFNVCDRIFPERDKPWLILGKGPTFSKYVPGQASGFYTLGLNHVGGQVAVDLAHVIDIDVITQCDAALLDRARYLIMPWIPHIQHRPTLLTPGGMMDASGITLEEWVAKTPMLAEFSRQGRLLCYNLATAPANLMRQDDPRIVEVSFFSASAAVDLIAQAGFRTIRTLGVDGGKVYDQQFDKLTGVTLLANRRSSFDLQFKGIASTIMKRNIDFAPLDVESPIRVFVGAEPEQVLAVKVLEHSIKKHASMAVRVEPLHQALQDAELVVPTPKRPELAPRTPFTYQRFAIPALKNFKGRAIYVDSDMQVFDDIKKLWTLPFQGAPLLAVQEPPGSGRRPQFSVMLLDCEALDWKVDEIIQQLDAGQWTYEELIYHMAAAPGWRAGIPSFWNDLERHEPGSSALTHYTDMDQQPWLETVNPIARVWCQGLLDAIADGAITRDLVVEEIAKGHVRPSLRAQIDLGIADPCALPKSARGSDDKFLPPHVLAASLAKYGRKQPSWRLRLTRSSRMMAWRMASKLGLWDGLKKGRQLLKKARQDMRVAAARRRHGVS